MVIPTLVDMLVRKIQSGETNPITGLAFTIEDIKIVEYKIAVQTKLVEQ